MSFSLIFSLLVLSYTIRTRSSFLDDFDHTTVMDDSEQFSIGWTVLNETHIEFGLEVNATGWIAIGVSPNGQMPNSAVNLAFVDDSTGIGYLYDMYTVGRSRPLLSSIQSSVLLSGVQNGTKTYIRFIRLIQPCIDEVDNLGISEGTTRLLFAYQYQNRDPDTNDVANTISYHGSGNTKGSRSINLLQFNSDDIPLPNIYEEAFLTMDNLQVPSDDTSYMCKILELPVRTNKQHIVRFDPIVTPENEGIVHHFITYNCAIRYVNQSNINTQQRCSDFFAMPTSEIACFGWDFLYGWGIGGSSYILPENVGYPMSGTDDVDEDERLQYIILEIHYDNPTQRSDIVDSSGFKITFTPVLRTYEAGILLIGPGYGPEHIFVPNNVGDTLVYGRCVSECTDILEETQLVNGSYIIGSWLHAHLVGTSLIARHIRDGVELQPIESNPSFDFNYQQFTQLDPISLLPGDEIIIECTYNTENRDYITIGGPATRDEMCVLFLYIYPKPNLGYCVTRISDTDWNRFERQALRRGYMDEEYTRYESNDSRAIRLWERYYVNNNRRHEACYNLANEIFYENERQRETRINEEYDSPYDDICEN